MNGWMDEWRVVCSRVWPFGGIWKGKRRGNRPSRSLPPFSHRIVGESFGGSVGRFTLGGRFLPSLSVRCVIFSAGGVRSL